MIVGAHVSHNPRLEKEGIVRKKKPTATRQPSPDKYKQNALHLVEYEITYDPIRDKRYRQLPRQVREAVERLYELAQTQPRQAIGELLQWIEKYPDVPMLYNYLSAAYSREGKREKAEQTILENYQRHPDYLFARLNYAEICILRGDYEKVAEILDNKFDLKLLYPHRSRFHITEFTGFMRVVGKYYIGMGKRDRAETVYEVLRNVAPDNEATQLLREELHPNLVQKLLRGRVTG